jgi:hypothetical protein
MFGMNGQSVFYVTGYNIKAQQKEENFAFERVAETLMRCLEKQEDESQNVSFFYQKHLISKTTLTLKILGCCRQWQLHV